MTLITRRIVWTTLVAATLVACSSGGPASDDRSRVGAPASITHIHGLGVDATGALFVATHDGLIKGADAGWTYASADASDHMGFSMHAADAIMYRSGHSRERPSLGVESSVDGASWTHLADITDPPVDFHAMAVSFADSQTLWGWDYTHGTFRSTDGAVTWTSLDPQGIEAQLYAIAGPPQEGLVYAGTASGLYRSVDAGDSWIRVDGLGEGWVIAVAADPADAKRLLAFAQAGMQVTDDGGQTWRSVGTGLPGDIEITSIALSPLDGATAYAADASRIFKTTDGGVTWVDWESAKG